MKSKRERVLERALEMAAEGIGECNAGGNTCPIDDTGDGCDLFLCGTKDCEKAIIAHYIRKAKAEGRTK